MEKEIKTEIQNAIDRIDSWFDTIKYDLRDNYNDLTENDKTIYITIIRAIVRKFKFIKSELEELIPEEIKIDLPAPLIELGLPYYDHNITEKTLTDIKELISSVRPGDSLKDLQNKINMTKWSGMKTGSISTLVSDSAIEELQKKLDQVKELSKSLSRSVSDFDGPGVDFRGTTRTTYTTSEAGKPGTIFHKIEKEKFTGDE